MFNYFAYYNGNASVSRPIPIAGQLDLNVDATSYVNAFGGFWITPLKILGGTYASGVAIPVVWNSVSAKVQFGGGTVNRSGSADGLGDIQFFPLTLNWNAMSNDRT